MDTQATNSTEPPPSNTPPPSDSAPKSPPPPSSPPLNASSPPPPTEASPPPPTAASPPPPQASSPPPPSASSPPPPSPSANPPPSPSASSDNAPPPTQSPEKSPSPPSTYLPPTPPEQPANDSHPSSPAPKIGTPPRNSPPVLPSDVPPVPPSDVPPVPPSDVLSPPSPPPSPLSPPSSFGPPLVPPEPPVNVSGKSESSGGGIGTGGAVAIGLLFLGVIGVTVFWLCRRKKKFFAISPQSESALLRTRYSPANDSSCAGYDTASELSVMGRSTTWYSYDELARATNEFSESNLLGEGGFGSVYKGLLPDGREVAVKQLKDGGGQGEREFRAEVETISRVHHRHLVSLFGYCISNDKRLLVYNYLPKDSLHFHLHGQGEYVLDWPARSKIAIGAARGIAYLHEDCHPRIVHRDIKSSNILLDNNFEAQVSDFGLARLFSDANTHVTTRVVGTFGYMAPEYASSGKLTDKSDVFSFGVVLLELITGRKPIDASQPPGEESLVEWARPLLKYALDNEEFQKLVDPRLGKNYVEGEMFRMIEAAAACVRHSALKRPKMSQILRALDDLSVSDLSNGMRVGESAIIDSQHSAEMRMFRRMAFSSRDYSTDFFIQGDFRSDDQ